MHQRKNAQAPTQNTAYASNATTTTPAVQHQRDSAHLALQRFPLFSHARLREAGVCSLHIASHLPLHTETKSEPGQRRTEVSLGFTMV